MRMTTKGETTDSAKKVVKGYFVEQGMRVTINQIHIKTSNKTEIIGQYIQTNSCKGRNRQLAFLTMSRNLKLISSTSLRL